MIDVFSNRDSQRGGTSIWNPQDPSWEHFSSAITEKVNRGIFSPMTGQINKIYKGLPGYLGPKTGKTYDPYVESAAALGLPRLVTLERDKAMAGHVSNCKKDRGNAVKIFSDKFTAAPEAVRPGEVTEAYNTANSRHTKS